MAIPERGTRKEAEVETRRILYSVGSIRRAAELKQEKGVRRWKDYLGENRVTGGIRWLSVYWR